MFISKRVFNATEKLTINDSFKMNNWSHIILFSVNIGVLKIWRMKISIFQDIARPFLQLCSLDKPYESYNMIVYSAYHQIVTIHIVKKP